MTIFCLVSMPMPDPSDDEAACREVQAVMRDVELERIAPLPLAPCVASRLVEVDVDAFLAAAGFDHRRSRDRAACRDLLLHRAGRACAAQLLARLGAARVQVGRAADGSAQWPEGFAGAITHTGEFVAVAVCAARCRRGLGIDLESIPSAPAAEEAAITCLGAAERRLCAAVGLDPVLAVMLAFSAKEALFKCLAPVCGGHFDFLDVEVTRLDSGLGRLQLRLLKSLGRGLPRGAIHDASIRWNDTHVFASVELLP